MNKKKLKILFAFILILSIINLVQARDNCNLQLKEMDQPTTFKQFIYQDFQKNVIVHNDNIPGLLPLSSILDELNAIFLNEYYSVFTPRDVKNFIEEIRSFVRDLNQNDPDIDNWHRDREGKIKTYYLVEYPLAKLNKHNFKRAYESLQGVLKKELGKFRTRAYKGEKNRRKRERLRERINGLNRIMSAIKGIISIKKELSATGAIRKTPMMRIKQVHAYLKKCNFKTTEIDTVYNKILPENQPGSGKKSGQSSPGKKVSGEEGNLLDIYITGFRKNSGHTVPPFRSLYGLNHPRFYIDNYLGRIEVPGEAYISDEITYTIQSFALDNLGENTSVLYGLNAFKQLNFTYFDTDRGYSPIYYLPYEKNKSYTMRIGMNAPNFITDIFSGCGFQAFGIQSSPLVTHANANGLNIGNTTGEKFEKKASAMSEVFNKIISNNEGSLRGDYSIARVFCSLGSNAHITNGGWKYERCPVDMVRGDIILRNHVDVYTFYYPKTATITGKRNGTRWTLSIVRLMPKGRKEVMEEVKQIWPVPAEVVARFRQ